MFPGFDVNALRLPYYDGAGNDFFVYDARILSDAVAYPELAQYVCDRQGPFGGADGLLVIRAISDSLADVELRIFNADGSEPEMCGNGARCAVRYLLEENGTKITMQTLAGLIVGEIISREAPFTVQIDLGPPRLLTDSLASHTLMLEGRSWEFDYLSFGNPHIVVLVSDVEQIDLRRLGPQFERAPLFPLGTNVHFVQVLDTESLRVRHWERGVGATLACGTGAAASAVVAIQRGLVSSPVRVFVPGGTLGIVWSGANAQLRGPVVRHSVEGLA